MARKLEVEANFELLFVVDNVPAPAPAPAMSTYWYGHRLDIINIQHDVAVK